jgi:heme oxygenase
MTPPAVPNTDGIMARLKAGTAAQHAVAESKPLEAALIEGSIGQAQYQKYLAQRWLIHRELEAATDRALKTDARLASLHLPSLYQTKNLESDLAKLQTDLPSIQPLPGATHLIREIRQATPSTLMGIYYVFEGSKNGARFIAKALAKAWGLSDTTSFRYLDPHGEEQRSLWMKFRSDMDGIAWTPNEKDWMVKAAQATFDAISSLDDAIHAG